MPVGVVGPHPRPVSSTNPQPDSPLRRLVGNDLQPRVHGGVGEVRVCVETGESPDELVFAVPGHLAEGRVGGVDRGKGIHRATPAGRPAMPNSPGSRLVPRPTTRRTPGGGALGDEEGEGRVGTRRRGEDPGLGDELIPANGEV